MTDTKEEFKPEASCSYCGKGRREASKLISGPSVYICDQCVWLCVHVLVEESMKDRIDKLTGDLEAANAKIAELSDKDSDVSAKQDGEVP